MQQTKKTFFQFVIPSVLSFVMSGVYTIVDGIFIGHSLGDLGLAAITLGYPVTALIQAVGTGIGLAGAIRYTILGTQGQRNEKIECFGSTILLMLLTSGLLTVIATLLLHPLLGLLGAEGTVLEPTAEYVRMIVLGTVFQVLSTGLVPFIRNMGGAIFSMVAMLSGFVANVVLDYLFVWLYAFGMAGAALASVIGQSVTAVLAVVYLFRKSAKFRIAKVSRLPGFFAEIFKVSFAPFGLTFSPNITLMLMNHALLIYGSEQSVAAYGCIGYITCIVLLLLQGVGDGCQPLLSKAYGENDVVDMQYTRRLADWTSGVIAAGCMALVYLSRHQMGVFFGVSDDSNLDVANYLPWFMAVMLFQAYTRVTASYLYAIEKSGLSYLLVFAEPMLLLLILQILPPMAGLIGVWLAVPLAQFATWLLAIAIRIRNDQKQTG